MKKPVKGDYLRYDGELYIYEEYYAHMANHSHIVRAEDGEALVVPDNKFTLLPNVNRGDKVRYDGVEGYTFINFAKDPIHCNIQKPNGEKIFVCSENVVLSNHVKYNGWTPTPKAPLHSYIEQMGTLVRIYKIDDACYYKGELYTFVGYSYDHKEATITNPDGRITVKTHLLEEHPPKRPSKYCSLERNDYVRFGGRYYKVVELNGNPTLVYEGVED